MTQRYYASIRKKYLGITLVILGALFWLLVAAVPLTPLHVGLASLDHVGKQFDAEFQIGLGDIEGNAEAVVPGLTGDGAADGFDLIREFRKAPSTRAVVVPILVLSGQSEDDWRARALAVGAADVLTKPFDPAFLITRIAAAVAPGRSAPA